MTVIDVEAHRRLDELEADIRPPDAPSLAEQVGNLTEEMRKGFEEVRKGFEGVNKRLDSVNKRFEGVNKRLEGVNKRLDSIDRCLDDDFGPRLKGLQDAVKRIEDGLPQ